MNECGRVVRTPVSYSGGPGLDYLPIGQPCPALSFSEVRYRHSTLKMCHAIPNLPLTIIIQFDPSVTCTV
jgi:hypothetical protein